MTAIRPCLTCGMLVRASRCETHQAEWDAVHERRRGTRKQRGYGEEWQRQRAAAIVRQPWCAACMSVQSVDNPLTVDHIIPKHRGGGDGPENLQVLCRRCNSKKGVQ